MANTNYTLMTNKELTEKYDELNSLFKESQEKLKENYLTMIKLSEEAIKIKEILNKRNGKK